MKTVKRKHEAPILPLAFAWERGTGGEGSIRAGRIIIRPYAVLRNNDGAKITPTKNPSKNHTSNRMIQVI